MLISIETQHYKTKKSTIIRDDFEALDVTFVGDIIASVDEKGSLLAYGMGAEKQILDLLKRSADPDFKSFPICDYVGAFAIITYQHSTNNSNIIVSTSCASPYVWMDKNHSKLNIIFDENQIIKSSGGDISAECIEMISKSHQLVARFPEIFYSAVNIMRVPAGHSMATNESSMHDLNPLIQGDSIHIHPDKLKMTLKTILNAYYSYYHGDIGLLYSGGLDSSCLSACFMDLSIKIPFIHLDYHGRYSKRSLLAASLTRRMMGAQYPSFHFPRFGNKVNANDLMTTLETNFLEIPNEMAFGNPMQFYNEHCPKYLITGQGADSLYAIDTFAPSTELIGFERLEKVNSTVSLRADLTLEKSLKNYDLKRYPNSINELLASTQFLDMVNEHSLSLNEHQPFRFSGKIHQNIADNIRYEFIAGPIAKYLKKVNYGPSSSLIMQAIRYVKWMRSLINVPSNYYNSIASQGRKLTPYLEGPMVKLMFAVQLYPQDCIQLKQKLEDLFLDISGFSHRGYIEYLFSKNTFAKANFGLKIDNECSAQKHNKIRQEILQLTTLKIRNSAKFNEINIDNWTIPQFLRTNIFF